MHVMRMTLNAISPIIILASFVLAIRAIFIKGATDMEARKECVLAIVVIAFSVYFYIYINSITGII